LEIDEGGNPMADSGAGKTSSVKQPLYERITKRDIAVFSRQLSLLLDVGMPLVRALRTLSKRTSTVRLAKIIDELGDSVEHGNTFANALANYPKLFSPMFVNIVKVGEVGGTLEQALRRLAEFTERELRYRNKFLYAMMYPFVVVAVGIIVIDLILVYVFPVFLGLFEDNMDDLPALTKWLASVGMFLGRWWPAILLLIVGLVVVFFWFRKTPLGAKVIDLLKFKMRLPIIGRIGQKIVTARVAETFSLLLKSGIQLIPAMRVVAGAVGNSVVSEKLGKAADEVEEGKSLQDSLMERDFLPPIVVDMLAVGDEAGSLDSVLDRVHESYSEEVDMFLDNLNRVIEPILIVFLGGAVLIIALAVFLPYWQVDETLTFQ